MCLILGYVFALFKVHLWHLVVSAVDRRPEHDSRVGVVGLDRACCPNTPSGKPSQKPRKTLENPFKTVANLGNRWKTLETRSKSPRKALERLGKSLENRTDVVATVT